MMPNKPLPCIALALLMGLTLLGVGPPATTRCHTTYSRLLERYETVCDDGTRGTSRYNRFLDRWETTVTPPPGQRAPRCRPYYDPLRQGMEVRCE